MPRGHTHQQAFLMGQPLGMDALGLRRIAGQAAQLLSAEAAGLIPAAVNGSRGAAGLGKHQTGRMNVFDALHVL